ncbi:Sodium/hydrogen exchanger family-domain-containing protein, partial [Lipomyces doorenjongii]
MESIPYHEPSIKLISVLSGFLLTLNLFNYGLNKIAFCGLIGQVVLGIAWGTPGGKLLDTELEEVIMQLGYLGLILLVFEGGLATSFKSMMANIWLSTGVAITGIAMPIGISFVLRLGATPLQAFTAGAALCSTSLGTTFTILGTSGLSATRLGVVLTSAAMIDDVVGLIMVQVIANLGSEFEPVTVIRPVFVSLAFAVFIPVLCKFVALPITLRLNQMREKNPKSKLANVLNLRRTAFLIHTTLLLGLVIAGTYAGTSSLLAAYIAGAAVSWWDSEVPHVTFRPGPVQEGTGPTQDAGGSSASRSHIHEAPNSESEGSSLGVQVFDHYYQPVVEHILKPFFFASIGFSIPITQMFSGSVVWRGVIYTLLMTVAKLVCGLWLVPIPNSFQTAMELVQKLSLRMAGKSLTPGAQCTEISPNNPETQESDHQEDSGFRDTPATETSQPVVVRNSTPKPESPKSLYPAGIIGLGMVARGEIGFLVSSLAQSKGIFDSQSGSQSQGLFLVVTWAITLCTVIGPICVGLLVNRVRKLESTRVQGRSGSGNVLGAWGV